MPNLKGRLNKGILDTENNKQTEYFSMIYDRALDILNRHDVNDVLEQIVVQAGELLNAPHGFIYTVKIPQELELKAGIGIFNLLVGSKLEFGEDFSGRIWQTGKAFCVADYSNWESRLFQEKVKTMIGVPLRANGQMIAVLGLAFDEKHSELAAEQELLWLNRFAELAAIALDNARLYSATLEMTEDVKDWVLAQEEISQLSLAVDQSPGVTIMYDTDGQITYVNAKFSQVTGYFPDEVVGKNVRILRSDIYSDDFYKSIWDTIMAGEEWRGEFYNKKKNGEMYWALASISPVKNSEGKVVYYLQIQQDLTKQKAIEKSLQDKNIEVQDTLGKLQQTQSQMIQQEKMAGIGHLAAGIAHEINNPLGFVLSNFDTLQKYISKLLEVIAALKNLHEQVLKEEIPSLYQKAEQISALAKQKKIDYILEELEPIFTETNEGLNRVGNIVKALRIFSRTEQHDQFEEYDLNQGVQSSLTIARNEVKYVAEVKENLRETPTLKAMGSQVNQVILNIIINATHAIKARGLDSLGLITVSTYADDQFVYCSIEDNGGGIPEAIRKDIFNPFFTTKPVGQGTGLGLSISYDIIVNKHYGKILCSSEVGEGSTFIIKLPLTQQAYALVVE